MRPIRFRAWDKAEKKMIDDFTMTSDGSVALSFDEFGADVILLQYTGLRDKRGIEIYEGDIILFQIGNYAPTKQEIKWDENDHCWFPIGGWKPATTQSTHCEVIGNIWKNPELIKK